MHDAGDRVLLADREQGVEVGDVGLHGVHGQVGERGGHHGSPALQQDALLAGFGEGADGVGADEAGASGNEDHDNSGRSSDRQCY